MKNNKKILTDVRHIYFIGIGGIGMCGLAEYLLMKGYKISGSDITESSITKRLEGKGAKIYYGHKEENINSKIDLVIYTAAVKMGNPELDKAINLKIKTAKRAFLLGEIVNDKFLIAISGTHGKTTTTSMVSKLLIDAGLDPTVFVGGNLKFLQGASYRIGNSNIAVVEADEYDKSFLTLKPDIILINNIELDHTDIYKNEKELIQTFKEVTKNLKINGYLVVNGNDKNIEKVIKNFPDDKIFEFGENCNNDIVPIQSNSKKNIFTFNDFKFSINQKGIHNIYNASATILISMLMGVEYEEAKKSLETFSGVNRRLELKLDQDIKVYDDYAHHPTEVKYSLEALKNQKGKRLVVVFQPHTYTRTKKFYNEFASALNSADKIYLMPVYAARENPIKEINSDLIYKNIENKNKKLIKTEQELMSDLMKNSKTGDCIVFQGAGSITNMCEAFLKLYKSKKRK